MIPQNGNLGALHDRKLPLGLKANYIAKYRTSPTSYSLYLETIIVIPMRHVERNKNSFLLQCYRFYCFAQVKQICYLLP